VWFRCKLCKWAGNSKETIWRCVFGKIKQDYCIEINFKVTFPKAQFGKLGTFSSVLQDVTDHICSATLTREDPRFSLPSPRFSSAPTDIINPPYSITPPLQQHKQKRTEDVSISHL